MSPAQTTKLKLGTGIIILPQRNPAVLAKELASIDVLSNGRLILGLGIGYLKPEFDAIGAPFDHKGPRTEEFLGAMIALWAMEKPEYRGRFVSFGGINAMPRPVQKPHPEVVFGGNTKSGIQPRRAFGARDGTVMRWTLDATVKSIEGLQAAMQSGAPPLRGSGNQPHPARTHRSRYREALRRGWACIA